MLFTETTGAHHAESAYSTETSEGKLLSGRMANKLPFEERVVEAVEQYEDQCLALPKPTQTQVQDTFGVSAYAFRAVHHATPSERADYLASRLNLNDLRQAHRARTRNVKADSNGHDNSHDHTGMTMPDVTELDQQRAFELLDQIGHAIVLAWLNSPET
jgi:hypothetical protein